MIDESRRSPDEASPPWPFCFWSVTDTDTTTMKRSQIFPFELFLNYSTFSGTNSSVCVYIRERKKQPVCLYRHSNGPMWMFNDYLYTVANAAGLDHTEAQGST